jgi:serine/threonine protein phosphatase PrpC
MTTPQVLLKIFGRSDVGKTRKNDEDSFVIADLEGTARIHTVTAPVTLPVGARGILVAVSDGMGGADAGEVASSMVVNTLRSGMSTVRAPNADAALRVTIDAANQHVFDTAQATGHAGMGATLTAVLFHGIYAYVAEIGDSRAYLLRASRIAQLTRDQSYVQTLIDAGALTQEESETSEYRSVILQAMGVSPAIVPVLRRVSVRKNDRILVCSDGLSGPLKEMEILHLILASETPESACARLVAAAVEHGGEDDITVVLTEVGGDGAPVLTDAERLSLETSKAFNPA